MYRALVIFKVGMSLEVIQVNFRKISYTKLNSFSFGKYTVGIGRSVYNKEKEGILYVFSELKKALNGYHEVISVTYPTVEGIKGGPTGEKGESNPLNL